MARSGSKKGRRRLAAMYCAGLFDGEGCVSIRKTIKNGSDTYTVFSSISNTHLPILNELMQKHGGRISVDSRAKPCGSWIVMGNEAVRFLRIVHPYTIIKNEQISVALEFWRHKKPFHRTNVGKPIGFIETCRKFHTSLKTLHGKKGKTPSRFLPREEFEAQMRNEK